MHYRNRLESENARLIAENARLRNLISEVPRETWAPLSFAAVWATVGVAFLLLTWLVAKC